MCILCIYCREVMAILEKHKAIRVWGNSLGLRLDKEVLKKAGLKKDSKVIVQVSDTGVINIRSVKKPIRGRYDIADLIAQTGPKSLKSGSNEKFGRIGKEVI